MQTAIKICFTCLRRYHEIFRGIAGKFIAASLYTCIEPNKNVNSPFPIIIPSERLNEQKQKKCDEGKRNAAQQDNVANKKKKRG